MPVGIRIEDLDSYGSIDPSKSPGDIFEVSKNSGTSGAPVYASDGSRQLRLDELALLLSKVAVASRRWISPDGHTWEVTIDNNGELQKEDLGLL